MTLTSSGMVYRVFRFLFSLVLLVGCFCVPSPAVISFDGPPIEYSTRKTTDPIAKLMERIDSGEVHLEYDSEKGYLPSVLKLLNVPTSSQVLVFSKTSFQAPLITRERPRALYFNDNVYIGWVQDGEVVEISSVDPEQGAIFYALSQDPTEKPRFVRQTDACLQCHASPLTESVPGHLFRSVITDSIGNPILKAGTFVTTQNSPMRERWGGWYVTGRHGGQRHMGNVCLVESEDPLALPVEEGANRTHLEGLIDVSPYLSPHSDLVALMVLEHQTQMHNLITHANYQARIALSIQAELNEMEGKPVDELSSSTLKRFSYSAEPLLKYLLFAEEAPLESPVKGTSGFAKEFESMGPRDNHGRSLRDFDLRKRTFKYPCSFIIYSDSFDGLPSPFRDHLYVRLWEILTGADDSPDYDRLSHEDRQTILEILIATKPGLPEYWRQTDSIN